MERTFDGTDDSELKLRGRQLLTALGPLLGVFLVGLSSGYSAVLLPQLKSSGSSNERNSSSENASTIMAPSTEEVSWIAASAVLPTAPGCWLAGLMIEKLGRKKSTMLAYPLFLVGWAMIGFAPGIACLLVGRMMCGLCCGTLGAVAPVYIGETSSPGLRGILLNMIILTLSFGILAVHALGTWLHWRTTAYVCIAFAVVSSLICIASTESPIWLINKGRTDQARAAWLYLRGWKSLDEYRALENSKIQGRRLEKRSMCSKLRKTLTSRYFLWPLGLLCLFFFTAQFSGYNVVIYYSVDLLMEVTAPENAHVGTLVLDVVRLVTSIVTCYLMKKRDRRTMSLVSGFGSAAAMFLLSLSRFLRVGTPWFPVISLLLYVVFSTMGLLPLPWMLTGELFPRKFKGLGAGLASGFAFICNFAVVKIAPGMFASLQQQGTFAIYGVVALLGTCILYLTLPETKDKTLQEIERSFDKKTKDNLTNSNTRVGH
ncbi:facilitated trehalose transporter Tret1-like [Colletes gigas]|uniref:facilitated trehalose transporter Tret1-like n=1 Tax=Colletes gigas TaxID=935657 RepID=UPI001C9B676F|nr:facilitated trehalose transporter Tret1-like [Colletes gigas]